MRKLSRRETLKWMGLMSASASIPMSIAPIAVSAESVRGEFAPWPELALKPITATGYGQDPNLIVPAEGPWPRITAGPQLVLLTVLSDIIVPAEGDVPSASAVGVTEVLDEWLSAPYPRQQTHRALIEPGLAWMDAESQRRFRQPFVRLSGDRQLQIVEDIAYSDRETAAGLEMPKAFFAGLRTLVVGAFLTSPEGIEDLGYLGNTPINGDYPGPTAEAMTHLEGLMEDLGLRP